MTEERGFEIPIHVVARRLGEETVILNLESGTYYGLDPVGARAWELIAEGRTFADICEAMLEEYEVEQEPLKRDIAMLVQDLREHGLIL